jgi:hypothetical protein
MLLIIKEKVAFKKEVCSQAPMAPICNLSFRRQRSGGLQFEVSPGKQFGDPISKLSITKKAGWWSGLRCKP